MHESVYPGLDKDYPPHQFVEVDVVVQREDGGEAEVPEHGDAVAQDQHQDQHWVEQQGSTTGSGEEIERVGSQTTEGGEVLEVDGSLYE